MHSSTETNANHFWDCFWMIFIIGWLVNFLVFMAINLYLGGDALNGKIEDGHYFLGSHGKYTEVGYYTFIYSKIHTILFLITNFVLVLYLVGNGLRQKFIKKKA